MAANEKLNSASDWGAVIVPSDTAIIERVPVGIYVGVAGDISMVSVSGTTTTFTAVSNGEHPMQPRQIRATGTTATGIIPLYNN